MAALETILSPAMKLAQIRITPKMFGALGVNWSVDESVQLQQAIDFAAQYNLTLNLDGGKYLANVTLQGNRSFEWEGSGAIFKPASNAPVIKINKQGGTDTSVSLRSFRIWGQDANSGWSLADGINLDSFTYSQDHIDLENIQIRSMPGFGIIANGGPDSLQVTQRLHLRNVSSTKCKYANLRLEGAVIEFQAIGSFFSEGPTLGALPGFSDATTHPVSPARAFRRASVEILSDYTVANTGGNNGRTPNRLVFLGCVINGASEGVLLGADYRTAGVYISAGTSVLFDTCDFENGYPSIWLARETGRGSNFNASTRGVVVRNSRFLALSTDAGIPYPFTRYDGMAQVKFEDCTFRGSGDPVLDAIAFVMFDKAASAGPFDLTKDCSIFGLTVAPTVSGFTGNLVKWADASYSQTFAIAGQTPERFAAQHLGVETIIGLGAPGQAVDALSQGYGSVATFNLAGEGTLTRVSARAAVNGAVTLRHNANNGAGSPLAGRILLKSGADTVMDTDDKFVDLKWWDAQRCWTEVARNF